MVSKSGNSDGWVTKSHARIGRLGENIGAYLIHRSLGTIHEITSCPIKERETERVGTEGSKHSGKLAEETKGQKITFARLMALLESQQYRCALTGRRMQPSEAALDHIVPRNASGQDVMSNVRWVCKMANEAKGKIPNDEFITLCVDVARHSGPMP
jgi:hypothetical protein